MEGGGGGGGGSYMRKNIYMHLPTLPRLCGMEGGGDCGWQIYLLVLTSVSPAPRKSSGSQLISFTISVPPVFLFTISTFDTLYSFAPTTPVIQHSFAFASASSSFDALYPFTATTPVIQHSFAFASASSSIDAV